MNRIPVVFPSGEQRDAYTAAHPTGWTADLMRDFLTDIINTALGRGRRRLGFMIERGLETVVTIYAEDGTVKIGPAAFSEEAFQMMRGFLKQWWIQQPSPIERIDMGADGVRDSARLAFRRVAP